MQIDIARKNYTWIGDTIFSGRRRGWGDPIVGVDKCIYWPPWNAKRVFKFDPETQQFPSLVGGDLGEKNWKWQGGALAMDQAIYCIPVCSTKILQNNINMYPEELGRLFAKKDKDVRCNKTFYGGAVRKLGIEKVFKFLVEECLLPTDEEWAGTTRSGNLPLFMIAASSCESCAVSVIYHLFRRNVHDAST